MKKLSFILVVFLILSFLAPSSFAATKTTDSTVIKFASKVLEKAVREEIKKPTGNIFKKDVLSIKSLEINFTPIGKIDGIENLQNLVYLHLENGEIRDISPLKSLKKLEDLDLWDNYITDLTPLLGLTKLTSLELNDNYFCDLTPLKGLINLTHLYLVNSRSGNKISDITPLSNLKNIISIALACNNVSNVEPLSKLPKIQELYLHHNQIQNVAPLGKIKTLQILYLEDNPITDYKPLKAIYSKLYKKDFTLNSPVATPKPSSTPDSTPTPEITPTPGPSLIPTRILDPTKVITFPDKNFEQTIRKAINKPTGDILKKDIFSITQLYGWSGIKSIEGIQNLENLTTIEILDGQISDLTPLKSLKHLTRLNLWNQRITDISPLASIPTLEELILSDNYFFDLSPLKGLVNLKKLSIFYSRIGAGLSDISPISSLTNLETLSLADNVITDLSPLSKLPKIRELYLMNNKISNVEPLSNLKTLKVLYLKDNPVVSFAPLKNMFSQLIDKDFTLSSPTFSPPVAINYSSTDLLMADISKYGFCHYGDAVIADEKSNSQFTMILKKNDDTWGSIARDIGEGPGGKNMDLSMYKYVILHMKGLKGGEEFMFGFGYGPTDYYYSQGLTTDWQDIVIDISNNKSLKSAYQFGFEIGTQWTNNEVGATIFIDGIKFSNQLPTGPYTTPK